MRTSLGWYERIMSALLLCVAVIVTTLLGTLTFVILKTVIGGS